MVHVVTMYCTYWDEHVDDDNYIHVFHYYYYYYYYY